MTGISAAASSAYLQTMTGASGMAAKPASGEEARESAAERASEARKASLPTSNAIAGLGQAVDDLA